MPSTETTPHIAIVLSFDCFPNWALSCYGNSQFPTPNWNQFASRTIIFDHHYATQVQSEVKGHQWWSEKSEAPLWSSPDISVSVISDHPEEESTLGFPPDQEIHFPPEASGAGVQESWFLERVKSEILRLQGANSQTLLWLKCRGIHDPETDVPYYETVLHELINGLAALEFAKKNCLKMICSARGLPHPASEFLQEGNREPDFAELSESVIHTPLLIRTSEVTSGQRFSELTQTGDLLPTLQDWFGIPVPDSERPASSTLGKSLLPLVRSETWESVTGLFFESDHCVGIRTETEFLRILKSDLNDDIPEMYAHYFLQPEDRWDINNLANQHPEEVRALLNRLQEQMEVPE